MAIAKLFHNRHNPLDISHGSRDALVLGLYQPNEINNKNAVGSECDETINQGMR